MAIKTEFAIAEVMPGKLNALVKNIMLQTGVKDPNEAVRLVNSGEWIISNPTRSWREEDGVIYFRVTSDGITGKDWIERLEYMGILLGNFVKEALLSPDFKPTKGVTTEVAVLPGRFFDVNDRKTKKIRIWAKNFRTPNKRRLGNLNLEIACLISEMFPNKELEAMGLRAIVTMHKPIYKPMNDCSGLLARDCNNGHRCLGVHDDWSGHIWDLAFGFAFEVSQVVSTGS